MTKEEVEQWLKDAVSDSFMDIFYYDRKECEEMPLQTMKTLIDNEIINKELLLKVYTDQIEKEFK